MSFGSEKQNVAKFAGISVPVLAGVTVSLIGLLVFFEWTLGFKTIAYTSSLGFTFKVNTAISFLACGLSLLFWQTENRAARAAAQILSVSVVVFTALTLLQYYLNANFGIDEMIARDIPDAALTSHPGRMSPLTALNFIFSGIGLICWKWRTKKGFRPTEFLAIFVFVVSFIAIVGHIYNAVSFFRPTSQTGIAMHAAVTFLILSIGMLLVEPERGLMKLWFGQTRGAAVFKRLMPATFLALVVLNWAGEMGFRAGWFDKSVGDAFGLVASGAIILLLIWWTAQTIHNSDLQIEEFDREREQLLAETQKARETAENANRLKDDFLATVSHELRTPLNSMIGWTRIYQMQPTAENMKRAAEVIQRQGEHQLQLIEDLLDVSRIITGKMRIEPKSVDIEKVIENALDVVRPAAAAKNIELIFDGERSATEINGDGERLHQVFWNLLSNAIKFTPNGGRISVILQSSENRFVQVWVKDTGEGIAPEFLPYVFDRFRQGEKAEIRRFGGLGLGLAIVKSITELHGGFVAVESEGVGRGATFKVSIPFNRSTNGKLDRTQN